MKPATKLIHTGERIDTGATPSLTVPIYETSTFVFDSVADVIKYQEGKLNGYLYSRYENPTVVAVEQKVAAVDGAEAALLFSSGMAAISTTLLTLLKPGDEILCSAAIYGGTFHIIEDLMTKFGVERRFITLDDLANLDRVIGPKMIAPLAKARRLLGGIMDPIPAFALGRGIKTMPLRVAQHNANALKVAQHFENHTALECVHYPGLTSHPDHAIAKGQMSGFGGVVTLDIKGGRDAAFRVFDQLKIIKRAASLGGVESICSLPILTSQYGLTDDELVQAGVSKGMVRISIGLEDASDLIADLEQARA